MTIRGIYLVETSRGWALRVFGHKLVCGIGAPVIGCLVITVLGRGLDLWEEDSKELLDGGGAEGLGIVDPTWGGDHNVSVITPAGYDNVEIAKHNTWGAREEGRCAGEASVVEVELAVASIVRPGWDVGETVEGAPAPGSPLLPLPDGSMASNFFFTPWLRTVLVKGVKRGGLCGLLRAGKLAPGHVWACRASLGQHRGNRGELAPPQRAPPEREFEGCVIVGHLLNNLGERLSEWMWPSTLTKKGVESYAEAEKDCARVVVAVDLGVENLTSASWGSDPKKA